MQGPNKNTNSFKQAFLKNLLLGLQACTSSSKAMSLQGRKNAIKSSADIAMAVARGGGANWTQALVVSTSMSTSKPCNLYSCKVQRWKKIVRRCYKRRGVHAALRSSHDIARRLVKKRTQVLRKMIPGGESLDELSLLHEALDYVIHLRAQVDVLRRISKAAQRSNLRGSCSERTLGERKASCLRE